MPFSPLFIAAMVATDDCNYSCAGGFSAFSPLFIAAMVATVVGRADWRTWNTFSPLFIAAMVATVWARQLHPLSAFILPFSPLFIAAMVATDLAISSRNSSKRRNHQRLYIIRVILTHRRCPVNFKRHKR